MVNMFTATPAERDALLAIDDLVNELALRVGRIVPRRNDARYPLNAQVAYGTLREDGSFDEMGLAWGFDLSCLGMGMITDRLIAAGDEVHVKICGLDGREHLAPMRAMHTVHLFGNVYRIGGQFLFDRSC